MESNIEPPTAIKFDLFDEAIIRALRKYPEGIRNTELNNESKINGKTINVKTFNQHLKWLVNSGVAERDEEARARVFYKLRPTKSRFRFEDVTEAFIKELVSLYEHRKELDERQAEEKFYKIVHSAFAPIRRFFYIAVSDFHNPVDFNLDINEAKEFFREIVIEISKLYEQNNETRAFFYPLLERSLLYGWI
jgi:hypothetical protein